MYPFTAEGKGTSRAGGLEITPHPGHRQPDTWMMVEQSLWANVQGGRVVIAGFTEPHGTPQHGACSMWLLDKTIRFGVCEGVHITR